MIKSIFKNNWLAGLLIFFMPVLLIIFLGSQMAYSQVKAQFDAYQNIPEVTSLSELTNLPAGQPVILRGQISADTPGHSQNVDTELIIYQERPADGRAVRYREEFELVFPAFVMELSDGPVNILPSLTRERVIQEELHTVTVGDRQHTGFRMGDTVSVQGNWAPTQASAPTLNDVTGITSASKQRLITTWQSDFQKVAWARNGFGLFSLLGIILLVIQWRSSRRTPKETDEEWTTPKTKTAPIT